MSIVEIVVWIAGLTALSAVFLMVAWWIWPMRHARLMRCPDTGAIALVDVRSTGRGEGRRPLLTVRSCDFWPARQHCARGCLSRHAQAAPGHRIDIATLRPFEHP